MTDPTWMDHYELNFWLWAAVHDGEAYLAASHRTTSALAGVRPGAGKGGDIRARMVDVHKARQITELEKYHFLTSLGRAMRVLNRVQNLFPSIQTAYRNATHLISEAKLLRDMVEHSDEYLQGKGKIQEQFVREGPDLNLPGDRPGTVDATSTIVTKEGHWLGGRLCVERALSELRTIALEAEKIPQPSSPKRPRGKA